jgi:hypothetical protein
MNGNNSRRSYEPVYERKQFQKKLWTCIRRETIPEDIMNLYKNGNNSRRRYEPV